MYDDGELLLHYTSTDKAGGLCFVRHPSSEINYAEKLLELAKAYRIKANADNWKYKYLTITSAYRSFSKQVYLEATQPAFSATPGTSNHGWGLAFDWGVPEVPRNKLHTTKEFVWMRDNAEQFLFFAKGMEFENTPEAWHFEIVGGRNFYYGIQ